jgi:hypothetical protein
VKEGMAALARAQEQQLKSCSFIRFVILSLCHIHKTSSAGVCHQEGLPLPHPSSERGHGGLLLFNICNVSLVTFVTCHLQVCATKKVCRYHTPAVKEGMAALARAQEQQAATAHAAWQALLAAFSTQHHATCRCDCAVW